MPLMTMSTAVITVLHSAEDVHVTHESRLSLDSHGLISEKPKGLSAKSAKSRPRVDFPKVQGPLCKISKISKVMNYFLTDNLWTGSTSPWTGRARSVHRGPTPARTTGTAARSAKLSLWLLQCAEAHRRGRKREREAPGARLGPHRDSSGVEEDGRRRGRLGGVGAQ
jgi:hypothetical protein